ncbi:MAG: hypothetical protein IBX72_00630 [Nitrospirae bacterium]|nr:hypothetical protein [Nitrospirota bacterium]
MATRIYRSINKPIRENPSFEERWRGPDKGLIICWEIGRKRRIESPELAKQAENGELPDLGWKWGVDPKKKTNKKYGSLNYLAEWQGIRGDDLDIDLGEERELICSKSGVKVIYTADLKKYV